MMRKFREAAKAIVGAAVAGVTTYFAANDLEFDISSEAFWRGVLAGALTGLAVYFKRNLPPVGE